jgi:phosphatidylglycerol:prolipoprotein diacylglycerol transferase
MMKNLVLVPTSKKELFGGMLFLGLGLWIGKVWMKFKPNFLDTFAIAIPLALTIQKIGCFFAGCCFGKPCDFPWAVQYPVYTLPHYHHYQQGLISQGELLSLPVHPAQLYEMLGALLIVILVIVFQKRWKSKGSSFLFSVSFYLFVRFIVEFFKDPLAHTSGGAMMGALNQTQWGIVIVLPFLIFLLIYREIRWKPSDFSVTTSIPSLPSIISFLSLSSILIVTLSGWFQFMEIAAILTFFILASVLTLFHIFKNYRRASYRLLYACLLVIPFLLMSQTLPEQVNDSVRIKKSKSIGIGFGTGNYDNSNEKYIGEGCDRISNTAYFNQKYSLTGASLNFRNENLSMSSESNYGINLILGRHTETLLRVDSYPPDSTSINLANPGADKQTIFGINPYIKYDVRWFGIGAGLHIGKLSYTYYSKEKVGYGIPASGRNLISVYPQAYLRIGPRDIAYLDYHLAEHFPSALPGYIQMIGLGSGFGSENGTTLRIGTLIGNYNNNNSGFLDFPDIPFHGIYATGYLPLRNGFILEPLILVDTSEDDQNADFHFSLGLRYELSGKIVNRPAIPLK